MSYTIEQKKNRYNKLPSDLKEIIISVESFEKIQEIGKKYSLMLDDISELNDEINLLILGLTKQNDFVRNIAKRLEINDDMAYKISEDVNSEILDSIRDSLRELQEKEEQDTTEVEETPKIQIPPTQPIQSEKVIADIERIGQFTLEKTIPSSSQQYNDTNLNREEILKSIEDKPKEEDHIPLVDHLLTTPIKSPQIIENKIVEEKKPEQKKSYGADPYREQI